jgi:uncharacterized glyoxalase superfamily protein PhnB
VNEEIYPMPSFPVLIVKDLEASANFYQKVLGFKHIFTMPGLVHLRWTKYADLLITTSRDGNEVPEPKGVGISLNFSLFDRFHGDMDAFAKQARENGADLTGPIDQPWNVREVTVLDPDGYKLVFTVPLHPALGFEDVIKQAANGH